MMPLTEAFYEHFAESLRELGIAVERLGEVFHVMAESLPNESKYEREWDVDISHLVGKTLVHASYHKAGDEGWRENDVVTFVTTDGEIWNFTHIQNCCESVCVEDIVGELHDLVGAPITLADITSNSEEGTYGESSTWTFYRFGTAKGYVTIRWYGSSNGFYSERVDIQRLVRKV